MDNNKKWTCHVCKKTMQLGNKSSHVTSKKHLKNAGTPEGFGVEIFLNELAKGLQKDFSISMKTKKNKNKLRKILEKLPIFRNEISAPSNGVAHLEQIRESIAPTATLAALSQERLNPNGFNDSIMSDSRTISEEECDIVLKHLTEPKGVHETATKHTLVREESLRHTPQYGLFGLTTSNGEKVYLNVSEPFCLVATGLQGSGKSHTVGVVLENCLLPYEFSGILCLNQPMAGLVFHYDPSERNFCEATGMEQWSKDLVRRVATSNTSYRVNPGVEETKIGENLDDALTATENVPPNSTSATEEPPSTLSAIFQNKPLKSKIIVLVSPTNFKSRKEFYSSESYEVYPLLFRWKELDVIQLKKLMRLNESDGQLYVSLMLAKLRKYHRAGHLPEFDAFIEEIQGEKDLSAGQLGPLRQRLTLLQQFISESDENKALQGQQRDLKDLIGSGRLVVADLTDPMLAPIEANGIFQVLLEQFRKIPRESCNCGKIVVCDEAHKYFDEKFKGGDGLANAIVETVRQMRHEAIRVIVSTQSPDTMPPELLGLSSVSVCHGFHSKAWYKCIDNKVPLPPDGFETVQNLQTGQALVYAAKSDTFDDGYSDVEDDMSENDSKEAILIQIRPRLTEDRGASDRN